MRAAHEKPGQPWQGDRVGLIFSPILRRLKKSGKTARQLPAMTPLSP